MLKKHITYTNLLGEQITESFYFHLRESDIVELEMSKRYGLTDALDKAVKKADGADVVETVKNIILRSYGEPTPDGRRFIQSDEMREEFYQSPAYDVLFMELVRDSSTLAEFIKAVFPKGAAHPVTVIASADDAQD